MEPLPVPDVARHVGKGALVGPELPGSGLRSTEIEATVQSIS